MMAPSIRVDGSLVGTVDERREGVAALYQLRGGQLWVIAEGLFTSNGLAFAPDGRTLYHADTSRRTIYAYDYDPDSGVAVDRRVFVGPDAIGADRARPDGAAVDSEGCYWSALYGGARVHRYDPDGRLMASFPTPAQNPTMPAFAGPDRDMMFLTSARDESGQGGDLFLLEPGVRGAAISKFKQDV